MEDIIIADRKVGLNQPTLIIAEVGVNHNGDIERGYELIDKAADAGVDVVKFQTYKAKNIVTKKFFVWCIHLDLHCIHSTDLYIMGEKICNNNKYI